MDKKEIFSIVSLGRTEIPQVTENTKTRTEYIPVGIIGADDYFQVITEANETSSTTSACIAGISDLIYGKGLYSKDETSQLVLDKVLSQEDLKRVIFDFKLYGNASIQVYWSNDHTKIIKMYHTPVQTLRAEKIGIEPVIKNYFYCTDWTDYKSTRNKVKIPAFGQSKEKMEILYIKKYTPGKFYYSLPDWFSALQYSYIESELSNFHYNNVNSGFLPVSLINFNNGIPTKEERDTIESGLEKKFTGTQNSGKFMVSFNDDPTTKVTVEPINVPNISKQYDYLAEHSQDKILVANRVTSPLLFGVRTASNGFSSNSEELKTAYSILSAMVILPFQSIILNHIENAFMNGGYPDMQLYFEQLVPLVILNDTAEATGDSVNQVQNDINVNSENPNVVDTTPTINQ